MDKIGHSSYRALPKETQCFNFWQKVVPPACCLPLGSPMVTLHTSCIMSDIWHRGHDHRFLLDLEGYRPGDCPGTRQPASMSGVDSRVAKWGPSGGRTNVPSQPSCVITRLLPSISVFAVCLL
ncbi:hypothetical protein GJAV_G00221720 [Gymnothorax javanicus]|nr:hypothetical protein GJAV_G00221720 [Gymnothorax javanicus]